MNMKKLVSGAVAGAMAMSMCAVSAFAATVEMDSEYPGSWAASKCIPKTELEAIGGDIKITLTVETRNLANTADQFLIRPMDYDNGWADMTPECTSDSVIAKVDGMFCIPEEATTVEFVLNGSAVAGMGDSGLSFQVQNVTIKSAELEAGSPQGELPRVSDADGKDYCFGRTTYEELTGGAASDDASAEEDTSVEEDASVEEDTSAQEDVSVQDDNEDEDTLADTAEDTSAQEAAPAVTEAAAETEAAPQGDTAAATTPVKTGNTAAATIAVVMIGAGAAAALSRKRK